jgi:hypothetical protein
MHWCVKGRVFIDPGHVPLLSQTSETHHVSRRSLADNHSFAKRGGKPGKFDFALAQVCDLALADKSAELSG